MGPGPPPQTPAATADANGDLHLINRTGSLALTIPTTHAKEATITAVSIGSREDSPPSPPPRPCSCMFLCVF